MTKFYDRLFHSVNYTLTTIFMIMCIYPFYYILIYSLSSTDQAARGVYLWPKGFTLMNYEKMFALDDIATGFIVSISRTVIGTLLTIVCCTLFAYLVTKKEMPFRSLMYRFVIITMFLSSGLIPWYLTMRLLGLQNNFLLYILPGAIVPFFLILIKTYIESIPKEIEDSGMVDGAGLFTMFSKIIFPLSMPIIATVAVFQAVGHWNTWTDNYFLVRDENLQTLQLILLNYLRESEQLARATDISIVQQGQQSSIKISAKTVQMTITMIVTIPVLLVYPFLQRFFVKGIMLGAVKG